MCMNVDPAIATRTIMLLCAVHPVILSHCGSTLSSATLRCVHAQTACHANNTSKQASTRAMQGILLTYSTCKCGSITHVAHSRYAYHSHHRCLGQAWQQRRAEYVCSLDMCVQMTRLPPAGICRPRCVQVAAGTDSLLSDGSGGVVAATGAFAALGCYNLLNTLRVICCEMI